MQPNDGAGTYDPSKEARRNLAMCAPQTGIENLRTFTPRPPIDRQAAALASGANQAPASARPLTPHESIHEQLQHTLRRAEQIRTALTSYRNQILGPIPMNPTSTPAPQPQDSPLIPAMQAMIERIHVEFEIIETIIYQI